MKQEKLILTLSWIIVIITLLSLIVTLNKFGVITGQATDTGQANVTIEGAASISFSDAECDFGSGAVDETATQAELYSNGTDTIDGSWPNDNCDGLAYRNDGNVDLTVNLTSDAAASDLIGGTSPSFEWIVDDTNCSGSTALTTYTEIDTSVVADVCTNLTYSDHATQVIDFHLTVPEDADPVTDSSATITVDAATAP